MANQPIPVQLQPTFGTQRFHQTLKSHKEVLDKYFEGFDEAKALKSSAKIFLDTNVLLRIYSTSFAAREKLLQFFKDYQNRIVLTAQVQWEYVKNRENVISTFSKDVTQKIPETFNDSIIESISSFLLNNQNILTDYPEVTSEVEKLKQASEKVLEKLKKQVQNDKVSKNNILYKDNFISEFEKLELLAPLADDYLKIVKKDYDDFIKDIDKSQAEKETYKTFPGCFEKADKAEDPYGDFLIYHEMLKYALEKQVDVIFLTYDVTKGDWMQKSKEPHIHYVENFYLNTGKIIYILDGKRTFDEVLKIDSKSLINNYKKVNDESISIGDLIFLLDAHPSFDKANRGEVTESLIKELKYNNHNTISEVLIALNSTTSAVPYLRKIFPSFSNIGMLRGLLAFHNPNYVTIGRSGEIHKFIRDGKTMVAYSNWLSDQSTGTMSGDLE